MSKTEITNSHNNKQQSNLTYSVLLESARINFKKDSILFILWGWNLALFYIFGFFITRSLYLMRKQTFFETILVSLLAFTVTYSIFHLIRNYKTRSYNPISISIQYGWVSFCVCLVVIHIIQVNTQHEFYLQQPLIILMIAFAQTITGGILRFRLMIVCGVIIGILSYITSLLSISPQFLIGAFAFLVAFIIPGHILYFQYKKKKQVHNITI